MEDAEKLTTPFTSLGFRLIGQRRLKAVRRWSQGEISLVINTGPSGWRIRTRSSSVRRKREQVFVEEE